MSEARFPTSLDARRAELDQTRTRLLEVISAAAANSGTAPTRPGQWSTAEIIYHLHLSERSIVRLLAKALASSERHEPADETRLRAEWERIRRLVAVRGSKVRAPEFVAPIHAPDSGAALDLLKQSRAALLELVARTAYDDLLRISRPHPFEVVGVLTGAGWLSLVAAHEERHTQQIEAR